jgi:ATP-dependent protease ClpP protease subunit
MAGDPFGLLLRQRIVFFGGEVRAAQLAAWIVELLGTGAAGSTSCIHHAPAYVQPGDEAWLSRTTVVLSITAAAPSASRAGCMQVNDFSADAIVSQLLLLDAQDPTKVIRLPMLVPDQSHHMPVLAQPKPSHTGCLPQAAAPHTTHPSSRMAQDIKLFINSPGGSVTAGMGIYDAMMMCRADVQTYCFGLAASMGAFLLGAGTKGKRYSMPNARIMIHQPLGGASGAAVDIEIQAKEIMYHKANLNRIMAQYCGQAIEKVRRQRRRGAHRVHQGRQPVCLCACRARHADQLMSCRTQGCACK